MNRWINVLKTGHYTDRNGIPVDITGSYLDDIVKNYNPELSETPLVIGHPKHDDPAFGWVEKYRRVGNVLQALPKQVVAEFAEAVNEGRYKYVSCALRGDKTVRHIGFLGAEPPSVKGLGQVALSENDAILEIELSEYNTWKEQNLFRNITGALGRLRDMLIEKFDADTANKIMTSDDLMYMQRNIDDLESTPENDLVAFSENSSEVEMNRSAEGQKADKSVELSEENKRLKEENEALKKAEKDAARKVATNEFSEFCNGLVQKGTLTPAVKTIACELSEVLCDVTTDIELSEADGKKVKCSPVEHLKALLGALPKAIELGEVATPKNAGGAVIDQTNPEAISKAAKELQFSEAQKGRTISISTAVDMVIGKVQQ